MHCLRVLTQLCMCAGRASVPAKSPKPPGVKPVKAGKFAFADVLTVVHLSMQVSSCLLPASGQKVKTPQRQARHKRKPVDDTCPIQTAAERRLFFQLRRTCKKPNGAADFVSMSDQFNSMVTSMVNPAASCLSSD